MRLQWDPDHDPIGARQERRAIQLGLRGNALSELGQRQIVEVTDLSELVAQQREHVQARRLDLLKMPAERVYVPDDAVLGRKLGLG